MAGESAIFTPDDVAFVQVRGRLAAWVCWRNWQGGGPAWPGLLRTALALFECITWMPSDPFGPCLLVPGRLPAAAPSLWARAS